MIDMTYKNFLEKVITLIEPQVHGNVELRYNNYGVMPYYDIMVKFKNTDIQIALDCQLGSDVWNVYAMCKAHPDKTDVLTEQCAKDMIDCLKTNLLDILFKN